MPSGLEMRLVHEFGCALDSILIHGVGPYFVAVRGCREFSLKAMFRHFRDYDLASGLGSKFSIPAMCRAAIKPKVIAGPIVIPAPG